MVVKIDQVRERSEQTTSPERLGDIGNAMDKVRILAISSLAALGISTGAAMAEQQKPVEVADASGKIVLANYSEKKLTQGDINNGIQELTAGFIGDGETEADAKGYAQETVMAFLDGKNDGGAEYIAKFAPKLTAKILAQPEEYKLAIVLDTEVNKLEIAKGEAQLAKGEAQLAKGEAQLAKTEAQLAALKELNDTLSGKN